MPYFIVNEINCYYGLLLLINCRIHWGVYYCIPILVMSGPDRPIFTTYFRPLQGLGCFYMVCWIKKHEHRPYFQSSHFNRKSHRYLLRLKLVIVNTTNFRLILELLRGYKYQSRYRYVKSRFFNRLNKIRGKVSFNSDHAFYIASQA